MMDVGEVKARFRNYLSIRLNERRGREVANETTIIPNIFASTKIIPRPNASMSLFSKPNDIHQADILYLPHLTAKR